MPVNHKRLKQITFTLDGVSYECQATSAQVVNNTEDGERVFTLCPDGEFYEEADPSFALEMTFVADWTVGGISDVLSTLNGQVVSFTFINHPDDPVWAVQRSGQCKVKAPSMGGERGSTDTHEVTFPIIGEPPYGRP